MLHLVATRTGGAGASVAKLLLASGAKDFRVSRDLVRITTHASALNGTLEFRSIQEGYLPIHMAVEVGNMHVTKELLNMNADGQVKSTYGPKQETAFHAATRRRDIELLRILSDQGSPVDAVNVTLALL